MIRKILKHLGLREVNCKSQPTANAPSVNVFPAYDQQLGSSADDPSSLMKLRRTGPTSHLMLRQTGYIIAPDYLVEAFF